MTTALSKLDCVKYPFIDEAGEYVKIEMSLNDEDLASGEPSTTHFWDLAEKRITSALIAGEIELQVDGKQDDSEIPAYRVALMLIGLAGDERAQRKYALAEAKRASAQLKQERTDVLLQVAEGTFRWRPKVVNFEVDEGREQRKHYEFGLPYAEYLRNAPREAAYKLTNRILERGYVYCTQEEFARLLETEVQSRILSSIVGYHASVTDAIAPHVDRIRKLVIAEAHMYSTDEMPKVVLAAAMPPCMKALLSYLSTGKHISHIGRFAVTSFLSNIGVTDEEIIRMFRSQSDFSDRIARYQVEHISGSRGGKKKYTPPSCKTMKTHSICINPDQLCTTIAHPLSYYRKKARMITATARRQRTMQAPKPASS